MKRNAFPGKDRVPLYIFLFSFLCIIFFFPRTSSGQRFSSRDMISTGLYNPPQFLRLNEINPAAYRHFREHFPNCNNENWVKDQKLYTAVFTNGSAITRVYYKLNGDFEWEVKSYGPELLGNELKALVCKSFAGYSIKTITEINDAEGAVYFIKIVSPSNIKTLKCTGNEISITEDYINGGI
jgi:hypothetical protein